MNAFGRTALLVAPLIAGPVAAQHPVEARALERLRTYAIPRATSPVLIDGRTDDEAWQAAPWSEPFVDIEGAARPAPPLRTRMRMLWDSAYLYVAAELAEPHVWATLTERDAVIFHDDDFELFIDPDGDTHLYYELEVNALGTVWDLLLTKPYRDGGRAIDAWDVRGLQVAVHVDGTRNDPADADRGWSVELAIPWAVLREAATEGRPPRAGEQWRMNFSRVDWDVEVRDGRYLKRTDPATGKPLPEHNWVWSPQGAVNMHMPERWGVVEFRDGGEGGSVAIVADTATADALRALYHAQRRFRERHGHWARTLDALDAAAPAAAALESTTSGYEITAPARDGGRLHIREDGRQWRSEGGVER